VSGRKNAPRHGSCSNALRVDVDVMDEAILNAIEEHALTEAAVKRVVLHTERDDHG
jgi:hypothetical protein